MIRGWDIKFIDEMISFCTRWSCKVPHLTARMRSRMVIGKLLTDTSTHLPPRSHIAPVSAMSHRRTVFEKYEALPKIFRDSIVVETERQRHKTVRIHAEAMLTRLDSSSLWVLSMSLVTAWEVLEVSSIVARVASLSAQGYLLHIYVMKHKPYFFITVLTHFMARFEFIFCLLSFQHI